MTFNDFLIYAWDWRGIVIFFLGVVVGILIDSFLAGDDHYDPI